MELWRTNRLKRINLLEGSVSSGKTWISLVLWAFWVKTMPDTPGSLYLMSARSLTTLKRNCLLLLQDLVGESNFTFAMSAKEGWLFGRHVLFEGANDAQAETKIRGLTLQGAYCDELTKMPEDFFTMLLSRLRKPGAKLIATTNPDTPTHWLRTKYIDRRDELDFLDVAFTIDDNTTLPPEYIENIKKEYVGVFFRRFILGEWCVAEGLVYDFGEANITDEKPDDGEWYISVDYGTMNPFAALLWCLRGDKAVLTAEYYYSGRTQFVPRTDEEYCDEVIRLAGDRRIKRVVVDPSAASFIASLRKRGMTVMQANNDVMDGIRRVAVYLRGGNIKVCRSCTATIAEFGLYRWDEKATEDKVVKADDHAMDALRYFANTILRHKVKRTGGE